PVSSHEVAARTISPDQLSRGRWAKRSIANKQADKPLFMSTEPRPYNAPLSIVAAKGSCTQGVVPSGTVSRWPVKTRRGPGRVLLKVAIKLLRRLSNPKI